MRAFGILIAGLLPGVLGGQPACAVFPSAFVPFLSGSYATRPNAAGDRLLVGSVADYKAVLALPLPAANGQVFCGSVALAEGRADTAYVPTAQERQGRYAGFADLLLDPLTGQPFPSSGSTAIIPPSRLGTIFAWRIAADGAPLLAAFTDDFRSWNADLWRITDHEGPGNITRRQNVFLPGRPPGLPACPNVPDDVENLTLFVPRVACAASYTRGGTGAELETLARAQFGRFDITMKTSAPSGAVNGFFVYLGGENLGRLLDRAGTPRAWDAQGDPLDANEIDIEILSRENAPDSFLPQCRQGPDGLPDSGYVHFSVHLPAGKSITYRHRVCFAPWKDFHTYSFEWRPGEIAWYIDGSRVDPDPQQIEVTLDGWPVDGDSGFQGTANVPQFPANLFVNHWTNGDAHWSGGPPSIDASMEVREVRYTPLPQ